MKHWSAKKKIFIGLLLFFLLIQFIQPKKNLGNPYSRADIFKTVTVPDSVKSILLRSCYDCHSNRTNYPWYDYITPVNWWVAHHINEGKAGLNFSDFKEYSKNRQLRKLEEIIETVSENEMPLPSYLVTHGDAELSNEDKTILIRWAKESMLQLQQ